MTQIEKRLQNLEEHLASESKDNPTLFKAVQSYRDLDKVAYRLGILDQEQSYATRVSWWPMIAVLGTFSSGKSTFINTYLGKDLQRTGNQAVDDKFTVISYSSQPESRTLPGVALDADPRFPFFQISRNIAEISASGQQRIDAYLQLKTCPSESLRNKILIDSPGFDADSQRAATLRLTEHIIELADLVLVFFDARHPEPGAMHDTLDYLVTAAVDRSDFNKFLYILNQIDITAREDNPEEVVAAWQRALAQAGLTAGRFYRIYNPDVAIPIENETVRKRFEAKRDADMSEIDGRMQQVEVERSYRIIGNLEQTAKDMEHKLVPQISGLIQEWRRKVFFREGLGTVVIALIAAAGLSATGTLRTLLEGLSSLAANPVTLGISAAVAVVVLGYIHFAIRKGAAQSVLSTLQIEVVDEDLREQLSGAFRKNTAWWRSLLLTTPSGWGRRSREDLLNVLGATNEYVQKLNDRFTNPSGSGQAQTAETQGTTGVSSAEAPK